MNKASFADIIREKGELIYTCAGNSMNPLIHEGDLVVIQAVSAPLKKYDVPLYRRDSGQYVLHRIIGVRKNDYLLCGDNRFRKESGITDRHIIGVLTAVIRNGKTVPVNGKRQFLYRHTLFLRRIIKRLF